MPSKDKPYQFNEQPYDGFGTEWTRMNQKRRISILDIITFILLGAVFIYLLSKTWNKWGDIIIDTSRELWLPAQLLKGKVLYKDIFYIYGFFAPYIVALAYAIFGIHISTVAGCGIIVTVLTSLCLYKISRLFLNEMESMLVILTFLFVYAFGFYVWSGIFNFILPYSFASTLLTLFTSLALYLFLKYLFSGRTIYLLFWALAVSCALLCRIETALAIWAGFAFLGVVLILKNGSFFKRTLYLAMPIVIAFLAYYIFLFASGAFFEFKQGVFDYLRLAINSKSAIFGLRMSGLDNIGYNITLVVKSFILYFTVVLIIAIFCRALTISISRMEWDTDTAIPMVFLAFAIFMLTKEYFSTLLYRPIPVILIFTAFLSFYRIMRGRDFRENMSMLSLSLIPLLLASRVALNSTPHNYGFNLLPLGLICYFIFFLRSVKDFLVSHIKVNNKALSASLFAFFLLLIIPSWDYSLWLYNTKNLRITSWRGDLFCWRNQQTIFFWQTVDYIAKNTPKTSTVVTFPEGVSINFFADRDTPLKYYTFLPHDIEIYGEENIVTQLKDSKVDYIVILSRDLTEYGYAGFGIDYAKKIFSWIEDTYEIAAQFGPLPYSSQEFGIAIYRKKGVS